MRPKIISKFGFDEINELSILFEEKGWNKFDEFESFFSNYCSMLEHLNPEQSSLVMDLTKEFLWLRSSDYYSQLKNTLVKLQEYEHLNLSTIHIIPLISQTDREAKKTKSSSHVAYLCQISEFKYNDVLKNTIFRIHDNLNNLPKIETLKRDNNPIILIDDFIGTGDTAIEALEEVLNYRNYDNETLFIASLICQQEGKKVINDKGYEVISPNIRSRGISDKYEPEEITEIKELMEKIENILKEDTRFDKNFSFGYKSSEALVALIRTPNNTFPIYWFSAKIGGGKKWMAPFPR